MINWLKYYNKIPSRIKIGTASYNVLWVDEFPKDKRQLGETSFIGEKQIVIKLGQSHKEAVHTYWHEILHAISEEFDAGLSEKQVQRLEKSLSSILKNGNLFKEVKDETDKRKRRNSKRIR